MLKKTKIVCTMGPSTQDQAILTEMLKNGMNCARFNFSHGNHAQHTEMLGLVRRAANAAGIAIGCMLDTKGPEMRLGEFAEGRVSLVKGEPFILTHSDEPGNDRHVSVSHKKLYKEVQSGDRILLSDGLVELLVEGINNKDIVTRVLNNGEMSNRKRVAAPGVSVSLPPVSAQDEDDIIFGIEHDMDFVAASFIQRASDIDAIRHLIAEHNGHMEIIAKIENLEGVRNFDAILEAADGIMVARGDLGVEIAAEDVPLIQKDIISKCNKMGKPVIVATQMLESMTNNPRPTRAEASDVANAILDGTDAIMLSGETASGSYPIEAVGTMNRIAQRIESSLQYKKIYMRQGVEHHKTTTDAIAHATVQLAYELDATAIIAPTESGYTANIISKYRPKSTIIAYAADARTAHHLTLRWGVYSVAGRLWDNVDAMVDAATCSALASNYVLHGDCTIITSGIKVGTGNTNCIRAYTV